MNHADIKEKVVSFARTASFDIIPKYINAEDLAGLAPGTRVFLAHQASDDIYMEETFTAIKELRKAGLSPIPHIAARRIENRGQLESFMAVYKSEGIKEIFAIAGDVEKPEGRYLDTMDMLQSGLLDDFPTVGISGYPDGHRTINTSSLFNATSKKIDHLEVTGQTLRISSQLSFNTAAILDWLKQIEPIRQKTPVDISLPGPAGVRAKARVAYLYGTHKAISYLFSQKAALPNLFTYFPNKMVTAIAQNGPSNISPRFSTFGNLRGTIDYVRKLQDGRFTVNQKGNNLILDA